MPDDLTPEQMNTPNSSGIKLTKTEPVHPLMRRPPVETEEQPPRRQIEVAYTYPRAQRPYLTWALVAINIALFALTSDRFEVREAIVRDYANQPFAAFELGQPWRLFTSMFLHVNLPHVLLNMLALYSLGPRIEITFGHARYLLMYLLGGLAGSLASAALQPIQGYALGASGAVFAVFGAEAAFLLVNLRELDKFNAGVAKARLRYVLLFAGMYFAIGFFGDIVGGNLDNWAHIGGFVGGAALTYFTCPRYRMTLNAEQTKLTIDDLRPRRTQVINTAIFAALLLGLLMTITVIR